MYVAFVSDGFLNSTFQKSEQEIDEERQD